MNKLRWTLLLLVLGIALPTALIVQRAITSLEIEKAIQHEAVAERVFDEMERALSDVLLREESRSVAEYARIGRDLSTSDRAQLLSTTFANAEEPFIRGWFSLTGDGRLRLLARSTDDNARIATSMREALHSPARVQAKDELDLAAAGAILPAPGRTRSVGKEGAKRKNAARTPLADAIRAEEEASSAYEVLQSLNRAGADRSARQSKALRKAASPRAEFEDGLAAAMPEPAARIAADLAPNSPAGNGRESAPSPDAESMLEERADRDESQLRAESRAIEGPDRARPNPAPDLTIDPMIGRAAGTRDLVLARSVWQGETVERQGLVLDRSQLVAWLEERVLAPSGLATRSRISFPGAEDMIAGSSDRAGSSANDLERLYIHRFAEPFAPLIARLELDPLPGLGSARPIYALATLLGLVALLGLFAVDRMTRVVIEYAQRRGNFVAAVSHELKTPITSIRMYGEMLRDGLVPSEAKRAEYYATITDESERLSRLIDNVLEFSRLEQNRRESNLVVGGLEEAVHEAAEKLRPHVEREGFELELELGTNLPAVQYDRDAVTQLVFNLIDNALKYARAAATRRIVVGIDAEENGVVLRVRDYGPGVPEAELRRIFEPFYRVGEELTRTSEGTGIGLALVKELAEGMGAGVAGRNEVDGGFAVLIRFARAAA